METLRQVVGVLVIVALPTIPLYLLVRFARGRPTGEFTSGREAATPFTLVALVSVLIAVVAACVVVGVVVARALVV